MTGAMRWVLSAGVAIVAIVSACGDDSGSSTSTPSSTPGSTPSATVSPAISASLTPTPDPNLITRGPDIDFPDDAAMIIEGGCWGCDGGPVNVVRVYRDTSGTVQTEPLLTGLKNGLPADAYLNGEAMTQDASVMAVSFCYVGTCAFSGLTGFEADSQGVAYRSLDGGITWQEVGRGGPVFFVDGVLTNGDILVTHSASDDGNHPQYFLLPGNTPVTAPDNGGYPPATISNQILWPTSSGELLTADGKTFGPTFANRYYMSLLGSVSDSLEKGAALTYWYIDAPTPRPAG